MAKILDGKKLANDLKKVLALRVKKLLKEGITPGLAIILVGDNPASKVYVNNKCQVCEELGINCEIIELPKTATNKKVLSIIDRLNKDRKIHGIVLQLPVPKQLNVAQLLFALDPLKDVDGLHPVNLGMLAQGKSLFVPATPLGILKLLEYYKISVKGKHVVIVGYGQVVGMPLSLSLASRQATVSVAQEATKNLSKLTNQADILITATGQPGLIKASMVKNKAVVVDAGTSKVKGKFVGDVDFASVSKKVAYITPTPGGVGPMTVISLVENVVISASRLQ